ncbi:MAG: molybdopterin cofactor-binding domain-containing protein, partial [Dehalobacterium sp.]
MTDYNSIGKSYPLIDAADKATGKYRYLSDVRLPGMLWGKVLRSPKPHALIKKIDISEAEKLPGVKAVITGADIPGILCGPFMPDWNILPAKKVTFVGQEVAAVAATSLETAEKAISLIKVTYEDLPAVFDPEEAMKFDAPIVPEAKHSNIAYEFDVSVGDVDKAFQESDYVKELTFSTSSAFHAYLEPNGSVASYDPVANTYTIWAATQVPYKARLLYSRALGIEMKDLRLIQANMGGAFGGKFESNLHLVNLYLAKKAGQPVRLVNSMEEEFFTATLRVPMKITVKVGIKKDGTIMAKDTHIVADNGARTNYGPASVSTACYRVDSLYRIKNTRSKGYLVYTNNVPKGAMRGFGNPQMLLALEAVLDMLAEESGLDPGEIRLKNCFKAGEESVHGWKIGSCGLPECIAEAKELSHWDEKRKKDNFSKCQRLR